MDTSGELLKACNVTAGQVVRIKRALKDQAVLPKNAVVNTVQDLTQCPELTINVVQGEETVTFSDVFTIENEEVVSTDSLYQVVPKRKERAQLVFRKEEKATDEKWLTSFQLPTKVYMKTIKIQTVTLKRTLNKFL